MRPMVQASSEFVRLLRTFSPCHMVTGASDGFAPNFSSKASASWFSSSSVKTWGSRLRAANSLRPVASRVARADYPQAQACPHTPRTSGKEGLEDDVGEVGLLGDDLLQLLGRNGQNLPVLARYGLKDTACPVSMFRSPTKRPGQKTPIVPRASPAKLSITSTSPSRTTTK